MGEKGLTIAFAESMTGGALSFEMIKNPGASKIIKGSIVAYSRDMKVKLLGLNEREIEEQSLVSSYVAKKMAQSIQKMTDADIGVGLTGNAGPSKQLGTDKLKAWIAIAYQGETKTFDLDFFGITRIEAIQKTVKVAYEKIYELVKWNLELWK